MASAINSDMAGRQRALTSCTGIERLVKQMQKHLSLVLSLLCLVSIFNVNAQATSASESSKWSEEDICQANACGLIPDGIKGNYMLEITRLQFIKIMINLVEKFLGPQVDYGDSYFTDTTDSAAQAAKFYGISNGTGDGSVFSPSLLVTREQAATMLFRALNYIQIKAGSQDILFGEKIVFADESTISEWAMEEVLTVASVGVMRGIDGIDGAVFSPQSNISIEESIVTVVRSFNLIIARSNVHSRDLCQDFFKGGSFDLGRGSPPKGYSFSVDSELPYTAILVKNPSDFALKVMVLNEKNEVVTEQELLEHSECMVRFKFNGLGQASYKLEIVDPKKGEELDIGERIRGIMIGRRGVTNSILCINSIWENERIK